jgi:hypothetical protein
MLLQAAHVDYVMVEETKVVLINSHLAASQKKVEKRNANVAQIMSQMRFSKGVQN